MKPKLVVGLLSTRELLLHGAVLPSNATLCVFIGAFMSSINSVVNAGISGMQKGMDALHKNAQKIAGARNDGPTQAQTQANTETAVTPETNTSAQGSIAPIQGSERLTEALVEQKSLLTQFQASAKVVETGMNLIDSMLNNE